MIKSRDEVTYEDYLELVDKLKDAKFLYWELMGVVCDVDHYGLSGFNEIDYNTIHRCMITLKNL